MPAVGMRSYDVPDDFGAKMIVAVLRTEEQGEALIAQSRVVVMRLQDQTITFSQLGIWLSPPLAPRAGGRSGLVCPVPQPPEAHL